MFGNRIEIVVHLKALSDVHLGTGDSAPFKKRIESEYRTVVKDCNDRPYIPGSTLKGAIRRLAETKSAKLLNLEKLLGTIRDNVSDDKPTGMAGRLLVRGGVHVSAPDVKDFPYTKDEDLQHTYIAARTSIDGATGVAENHKLFFTEMIPAGTVFKWTMLLTDEDLLPVLIVILQDILQQGLQLGSGKGDGQGEFAVEGKIEITPSKIDASGNLRAEEKEFLYRVDAQVIQGEEFSFLCEGPFIVNDSSWNSAENRKPNLSDKEIQTTQSKAQRRAQNMPLLSGTSIAGALKTRAKWLHALDVELKQDKTLIDHLFGTQNFQGLISIRHLKVSNAKPFNLTSLRIDRFSGAPIDGALFTTETFVGTRISFILTSRARLSPQEQALFEKLKIDLTSNGINLGHGTTKGFGWFKAETIGGTYAA